MTIFNLGSINRDIVYLVPHLPQPGETLAASALQEGRGGKGANQSVAIAKAGGQVKQIGAIGKDGSALESQLQGYGVNTDHVALCDDATGHAVIYVDADAENSIVLYPGANRAIEQAGIERALEMARQGDWLVLQNETNMALEAVIVAKELGVKVAYSAAPFEASAVEALIEHIDLIVVNEIEAEQLQAELPNRKDQISGIDMLVTLGSRGAEYRSGGNVVNVPAFKVDPVDTTGAGDTYLGYFLAGIDEGASIENAMKRASAAAALQVTQHGAATAIPQRETVDLFILEGQNA